jgi:hypothetical protein
MAMRLRFRFAGMALVLGGLTAGFCHLFNFDSPADLSQLAQYTRFSEPVHLVLFAGGILVLLGWFGQYALQCSASGALGFGAFLTLFVGILFGDMLHCILEFSIFPVLAAVVPYALPGLAETTYRSTPLAALLSAGHFLTFAGVAATALSVYRSHILPAWSAIPFVVTAAMLSLGLVPRLAVALGPASSLALYISMALLGVAVIWAARKRTQCTDQVAPNLNAVPPVLR